MKTIYFFLTCSLILFFSMASAKDVYDGPNVKLKSKLKKEYSVKPAEYDSSVDYQVEEGDSKSRELASDEEGEEELESEVSDRNPSSNEESEMKKPSDKPKPWKYVPSVLKRDRF